MTKYRKASGQIAGGLVYLVEYFLPNELIVVPLPDMPWDQVFVNGSILNEMRASNS